MVIFHILAKRYRSKITGQKNDEKKVFKNAKEVHKMLENVHEEKKVFLKVHEVVDSANEKLATFMFLIPTEIYVNILKYFVTTSDALEEPANSFWEFTRTNREISEIVHKCLECTSERLVKIPHLPTRTCQTINLRYNLEWKLKEGYCVSSSQFFEHNLDGSEDSYIGINSFNGEPIFIYWSPKDTGITTEQISKYSLHFMQKMPKSMQSVSRGNAAPDIDMNLPQFQSTSHRTFIGNTKKKGNLFG